MSELNGYCDWNDREIRLTTETEPTAEKKNRIHRNTFSFNSACFSDDVTLTSTTARTANTLFKWLSRADWVKLTVNSAYRNSTGQGKWTLLLRRVFCVLKGMKVMQRLCMWALLSCIRKKEPAWMWARRSSTLWLRDDDGDDGEFLRLLFLNVKRYYFSSVASNSPQHSFFVYFHFDRLFFLFFFVSQTPPFVFVVGVASCCKLFSAVVWFKHLIVE